MVSTCGHNGCDVRVARGLTPFCQMTLTPKDKPANVFHTYTAAVNYARANGGRVQCVTVTGGPKTFAVMAA